MLKEDFETRIAALEIEQKSQGERIAALEHSDETTKGLMAKGEKHFADIIARLDYLTDLFKPFENPEIAKEIFRNMIIARNIRKRLYQSFCNELITWIPRAVLLALGTALWLGSVEYLKQWLGL